MTEYDRKMIRKSLKMRDYQKHHLDTSKSECAGHADAKVRSTGADFQRFDSN
jgi:hypothetical protein